jgi:hypothetical protein
MSDTGIPPLYDEERGLRELARHRLKRDALTLHQVSIADKLAVNIERHFSAEETETAGRALLIGAASCATLARSGENIPVAVVVNILGFAAARMVADGRAWLGAQDVTPLCGPT